MSKIKKRSLNKVFYDRLALLAFVSTPHSFVHLYWTSTLIAAFCFCGPHCVVSSVSFCPMSIETYAVTLAGLQPRTGDAASNSYGIRRRYTLRGNKPLEKHSTGKRTHAPKSPTTSCTPERGLLPSPRRSGRSCSVRTHLCNIATATSLTKGG